jgi:hypothetical protein
VEENLVILLIKQDQRGAKSINQLGTLGLKRQVDLAYLFSILPKTISILINQIICTVSL